MSVKASALADDAAYELNDPGHTNWTEAELIVYINEAVRGVMRRVAALWPDYWLNAGEAYTETSNIVATTPNYDLPTDFFAMLMVTLTDSDSDTGILQKISLERAQDSDADGYVLMNQDIYLYPTPDADVTSGLVVYYLAIPGALTLGTETVPLSDHFEDAIKEYVVLKALARQERRTADFARFFSLIQSELDSMVAQTNTSDDDHGVSVLWRSFV